MFSYRSGLRLSTLQMEGVKQVLWSLGPSPSRSQHSHPSAHSSPLEVLADVTAISMRLCCLFVCCISIANYGKLPVCLMLGSQSLSQEVQQGFSGAFEHTSVYLKCRHLSALLKGAVSLSKENVVILPFWPKIKT